MIQVIRTKNKPRDRFMTTEEAKILWQYSRKLGTKWYVMVGLALFRGLRIGEICAMNIYDFQDQTFSKVNVILEKSHIQDKFPILKGFNELLREYVIKNKHMMKDGYLFPYYTRTGNRHVNGATASVMFCKLRRLIGKDYPNFLDKVEVPATPCKVLDMIASGERDLKKISRHLEIGQKYLKETICNLKRKGYITQIGEANFQRNNGLGYLKKSEKVTKKGLDWLENPEKITLYRITWHTCRRWFETTFWEREPDLKKLQDLMRYKDIKTPQTYISSYNVWKNEPKILEDTFGGLWKDFNNVIQGQTKLSSFV